MTLIAHALKTHGALRVDLGVEDATDILLVLISPQARQMLRRDQGRSMSCYRSIILEALECALFQR